MEYQKIINLLGDTNELSKFRTKDWIEINDEDMKIAILDYIRFKTSVIRSNLCYVIIAIHTYLLKEL